MSGQLIQGTIKDGLKRILPQKDHATITSAATPPPSLPSRQSAKHVPPHPAPAPPRDLPALPKSEFSCPKCGQPDGECSHNYEEIAPPSKRTDLEQSQYERPIVNVTPVGSNLNTRLRNIEDNQTRMRNEFNDFRDTVQKEFKTLQMSIKRLTDMVDSLDVSLTESFEHQRSVTDKMHMQLLENSDHLGKQILDIKRDLLDTGKSNTLAFRSTGASQVKKYTHNFEWDVGNLESMMKHLRNSSSQSYLIGQVDFKILGDAVCTRDGRLCLKMFGEFTHVPMNQWEMKNGNFECAAFIVDKSGKKPDLLVGKVNGDFNKEKTWMLGEVSASEITVNGYTARGGNVNVKLIIEGFA